MREANRPPSDSFRIYLLALVVVGTCLGLNFLLIKGESALEDVGEFLVVDDGDIQPADLIHVLGGRPERLEFGIQLYKAGYAPRLFITGGVDDVIKYRSHTIEQGVPSEDVLPKESWAITTYEEALTLEQFLDQEQAVQSVIVVSSPYHMRRSQLVFDWLLGDRAKFQFIPVPFEISKHRQLWWADTGTRYIVISEYIKILGLPVDWYQADAKSPD